VECGPDVDTLQVLWEDPLIRRIPFTYYDFESEEIVCSDELGYSDTLKPNGSEFQVSYDDGYFPRVAVIEGSNPGLIIREIRSQAFMALGTTAYVGAAIAPESSAEPANTTRLKSLTDSPQSVAVHSQLVS
jgi:hypothetical protein